MRKVAAIPVLGVALGLIGFGIVRGLIPTGPAHGVRLVVAVEPPVDPSAMTTAQHVVKDRIGEKSDRFRIVTKDDKLIVELGEDDPQLIRDQTQLLQRTGTLEIRPAQVVGANLDIHAIASARIVDDGVAMTMARAVDFAPQAASFVFDGRLRTTVTLRRLGDRDFLAPTASPQTSIELLSMIEAGIAHPLHVVDQQHFTRAVGFLPRAWPFLVAGAVFLFAAGVLWLRR